jgi:glycosyltransferase involved in cell wall biosynthesis
VDTISHAVEIILIDDCSEAHLKHINQSIRGVKYVQLEANIGRAKIRNRFIDHAQYEYLLFLDCDSLVINDDFLKNYVEQIELKKLVVCGGRLYPNNCTSQQYKLSWKYGFYRESQSAISRSICPNKSFMTNNFMVSSSLFQQIKFEELIGEYGHEDTLFGYRLHQQKIEVTHIDNPVLNGDIEINAVYLSKTETGIGNLILILNLMNFDQGFIDQVTLLKFYFRLKAYKLTGLFGLFFPLFKPFIKQSLINGWVSLLLFDVYKLGILHQKLMQDVVNK